MRIGFLLVSLFSTVAASITANAQDLKVIDHPIITVDGSCNPEGQRTTNIVIRNIGNQQVTILPSQMSAGDLTSTNPAKTLPIRPILGTPDKLELQPQETTLVQATVKCAFEDGDWSSLIQSNDTDMGKLRVVKTSPPFGISLDSPTLNALELSFQWGEPAHFRLKNADPIDYQITWEYSVNGHPIRSDAAAPEPEHAAWYCRWFCKPKPVPPAPQAVITIPQKGQEEIIFTPPCSWFTQVSVLKDQTADGSLTVRMAPGRPGSVASLTKTFPVKTHLVHRSGVWNDIKVDLIISLFLGLGAIFSLFLNFMLPNQMRKMKMKDQLGELGRQIANLSYALASRLRVLLGLEQRLVTDRLRNLVWTNSEFATEMQSIDQAMTRLRTRLQYLTTLGMTRTNFERMRSDVLPPTIMFGLEAIFDKVVEIGKKAEPLDDDVKTAQAFIKKIQDQLDAGILSNTDFAKALKARIKKAQTDFSDTGDFGKTATYKRLKPRLPRSLVRLKAVDEAALPAAATDSATIELFTDLDAALFVLDIVRQYIELVDDMPVADPLTARRLACEGALLELLNRHSCDAMYEARLLIQQMSDGFFKDDIEKEIKEKKFTMKRNPGEIRQFVPCEFSLTFSKGLLNGAAARDEWTCQWRFSPPEAKAIIAAEPDAKKDGASQEPPTGATQVDATATTPGKKVGNADTGTARESILIEEGWEVTHYFQKAETYTLKITLTHNVDGTELIIPHVDSFNGEISVLPEKRRRFKRVVASLLQGRGREAYREWNKGKIGASWILEGCRLAMALFIALIGLLGGAKDQLLKLEVVPAMLAIFLIGFGADQVKNLLTQKTTEPETSAPK